MQSKATLELLDCRSTQFHASFPVEMACSYHLRRIMDKDCQTIQGYLLSFCRIKFEMNALEIVSASGKDF